MSLQISAHNILDVGQKWLLVTKNKMLSLKCKSFYFLIKYFTCFFIIKYKISKKLTITCDIIAKHIQNHSNLNSVCTYL